MTLIDKLKITGTVGLISLASGCGTIGPDGKTDGERFMDGFTEAFIGGGGLFRANEQIEASKGNYEKAAAWGALGNTAEANYNRETQIEAAREGKTEVNVNIQQPIQQTSQTASYSNINQTKSNTSSTEDYSEKKKLFVQRVPANQSRYLFLYNREVDVNSDENIDLDEYFGIKNEFDLTKEDIMFCYFYKVKIGDNVIKVNLYNKSGQLLAESSQNIHFNQEGYSRHRLWRPLDPIKRKPSNPPDVMDRLDEFESGDYVLTATANGGQLRRAEFRIVK